jgi:glycosyltransferase involved in cell wall biosynthesis
MIYNNEKTLSFIIPSYNNLKHLKNVYASIKKHEPEAEIILLDDGSIDGTWEWIQQQDCIKYKSENRIGHTILYDKGIELATNEIVGILHADMIIGPNYIKNLLKYLQPGKVVCATRIEPPLHPEGKEKIIKDFGLDFDTLNVEAFEEFCIEAQKEFKDQTTKGMFAPWILYKKDFQAIGGHDFIFAPFPYEDSDIFQRWILAGYDLIQSRDAIVYHLTCRGHRWNEQIGKDDDYYKHVSYRASRNYLRKWGTWIKNNEWQYPIIPPKYDIGYIVKNCNTQNIPTLELFVSTIYVDCLYQDYINAEQSNTKFDLSKRIKNINEPKTNQILVEFDATQLNQNNFQLLQQIPQIILESGELGTFELDIFKIDISGMDRLEKHLIEINSPYYQSQLL